MSALTLSGGALVALPTAASAADNLFHPFVTYYPGSSPANVAAGDVTGDGLPDVVLTTTYDFDDEKDWSLWVYPQQGDGTLGAPTQVKTQGAYYSRMVVALADLDGDADLDAAVTTKDGVQIFAQSEGVLTYSWTVPVAGAHDLDLVDLNGDSLADLVVNGTGGVHVFWQIAGDFMSAPGSPISASKWDTEVEVADVTGDLLPDVVTATGSTVSVLAQRADRSFAAPVAYQSGGLDGWTLINGLAVGDIDGDDLADVHVSVGGNKPNSWVITRFQQPDGTLSAPLLRQSLDTPGPLAVAEVTGDTFDDLVIVHGGFNKVGVFDSTPGTNLAEQLYEIRVPNTATDGALAVADVTNDGRADVLVGDSLHGLNLLRAAAPSADITAPDTRITSGPPQVHQSRTATFSFNATEISTFTCRVDNEAWAECKSPMTYSGLSQGSHLFEVRATDLAGNTDQYPAGLPFKVEGPNTTITAGPTGTIRSTTATFSFSSTAAATYYQCSMDKSPWQQCGPDITYTGLATGRSHTFEVRAVNAEGLWDSSPATRTFTIEAAADLALTLSNAPDPVKRGSTLTYTLEVTNRGPNAAGDVVLSQGLPDGVGLSSVSTFYDSPTSSTGSCTWSGSTVRCDLGTIDPGFTWTVTVKTTVTASKGTLGSTAVVTTSTWDTDTSNDSASTSTKVGGGRGR